MIRSADSVAKEGADIVHIKCRKAIGGVTYGSAMPAFADQLTGEEVAAVLTHERTSWASG